VGGEGGHFATTIIAPTHPSDFSKNPCGRTCERR